MRKILSQNAPNDINMEFRQNSILGIQVKIPPYSRTAPEAATRLYDESFAVHAGKLWNILPKAVTVVKQLEQLKILLNKFLHKYPDQPPTKGYTASNRNSLIDCRCPVRWPAISSSAVLLLIPTSSYKIVKKE